MYLAIHQLEKKCCMHDIEYFKAQASSLRLLDLITATSWSSFVGFMPMHLYFYVVDAVVKDNFF